MGYNSIEAYVLAGKESAYGTAVTPTKDLGLLQEFTANPEQAAREIYACGASGAQAIVAGKVNFKGSMNLKFQNGRLFDYLFGSVAHALTTSDTKHTFTLANRPPSMTLEKGLDATTDAVHTYAGAIISSVTVGLALDGELSLKADWLAQDVAQTTTAAAAVIDNIPPLSDFEGEVKVGAAASETALGEVQSFELTLGRNPATLHQLGGRMPARQGHNQLSVTGKFTMAFQDNAELTRFTGGAGGVTDTAAPAAFSTIFSADNGVTLGSGRKEFYCNLRNAQYKTVNDPLSLGNFILQDFEVLGTVYSLFTVDDIAEANW